MTTADATNARRDDSINRNDSINRDDGTDPDVIDVWSRSASKYRVRAIVLLLINTVLFVGLGCFAYWIRTGVMFSFLQPDYWSQLGQTFLPRGDATLANFVLFPLRLDLIPMHGVVVGLLLAALVSIPILVSILYRFVSCIPFLLIVAFVAVMPWLAITLTGACILASIKPFRFRFRYASALLGMVLVMFYFYGASRQSAQQVAEYVPSERIKFIAPWLLATVASCLLMGGVLFLAKVVNYRPGVIAPLLVVSFALPVVFFEKYVGRDELYYQLLARHFQEEFYVPEYNFSEQFERLAYRYWQAQPEPKQPFPVVREVLEFRMALELDVKSEVRTEFAKQRDAINNECKHFLKHFPDSRYAANVLYLQGQTLDMRVDLKAFRSREKILRYYADFPSDASEVVWKKLLANAEKSRAAKVALYKLSLIEARNHFIADAIAKLDRLIGENEADKAREPRGDPGAVGVLKSAPADDQLKIDVDVIDSRARELRDLLKNNARDPRYDDRPLCGSRSAEPFCGGLLKSDPDHMLYEHNLTTLLEVYPRALVEDNVKVLLALQQKDLMQRVHLLESVIEEYPEGDALPQAYYRLAMTWIELGDVQKGRTICEQVVSEFPDSMWANSAREYLRQPAPVELEATN
ncbi:MAG: tetratricopeptide repeat protein [Phycisphaerae bacterium]|nr:tetratricopeptide repeat protein [Phycisphaerales bacterium]